MEIYFSIAQRKVLTPNDFSGLVELEDRLLRFQEHYEQVAQPFEWKFTRDDLNQLLSKLAAREIRQPEAAQWFPEIRHRTSGLRYLASD